MASRFSVLIAAVGMIALTLALTACEIPVELTDGWTIEGLAPPGLDVALAVAHDLAPCDVSPWGGRIEFTPTPIDCYGVLAAGCSPGVLDDPRRLVSIVVYSPDPIVGPRGDVRYLDRIDRTALFHEVNRFTVPYCTDRSWCADPPVSLEAEMNAEWRERMGLP